MVRFELSFRLSDLSNPCFIVLKFLSGGLLSDESFDLLLSLCQFGYSNCVFTFSLLQGGVSLIKLFVGCYDDCMLLLKFFRVLCNALLICFGISFPLSFHCCDLRLLLFLLSDDLSNCGRYISNRHQVHRDLELRQGSLVCNCAFIDLKCCAGSFESCCIFCWRRQTLWEICKTLRI